VIKPGRKFIDKQVWWWNDEVHAVVQEKKKAYKKWVESKNNDDYKLYRNKKSAAKTAVAKAKAVHFDELYNNLETPEGAKKIAQGTLHYCSISHSQVTTNYKWTLVLSIINTYQWLGFRSCQGATAAGLTRLLLPWLPRKRRASPFPGRPVASREARQNLLAWFGNVIFRFENMINKIITRTSPK